jgi:hypothetical protein
MDTQKTRVMMVLQYFPQVTQTYQKCEIEALAGDYDIRVIAAKKPDVAARRHYPYTYLPQREAMVEAIQEFRPHVLHTHYTDMCELLSDLAYRTGVPFTLRSHSFDVLQYMPPRPPKRELHDLVRRVNDDACLGVLGYPFTRPFLERAGTRPEKLIDCFPVVNFSAFHNPGPNGDAILNVGAAKRKKKMEDFIELSRRMPHKKFDLYAIGYTVDELAAFKQQTSSPLTIHEFVDHEEMPAVYKRHGWLVYTACPKDNRVGWPMAVAEAQASGLGVCMANLRPDLKQYVGDAGFLYDSIDDVQKIISQPYPEDMRQAGFEQAKRSDIKRHKHLLTDLWEKARAGTIRLDARHAPAAPKRAGVLRSLVGRLTGRA